MNEDDLRKGAQITSKPPYTYALGLEGQLIIGWRMGEFPDGTPIRMQLVLPAEESERLRLCLEAYRTTQATLAVKAPKQGLN